LSVVDINFNWYFCWGHDWRNGWRIGWFNGWRNGWQSGWWQGCNNCWQQAGPFVSGNQLTSYSGGPSKAWVPTAPSAPPPQQ
jgi:hypothetical protein